MKIIENVETIFKPSKELLDTHLTKRIKNTIKRMTTIDVEQGDLFTIIDVKYVPGLKRIVSLFNKIFGEDTQLTDFVQVKIEFYVPPYDKMIVYTSSIKDRGKVIRKLFIYEIDDEDELLQPTKYIL